MSASLSLSVLGELEVEVDGERVSLPPSKKTRMLLAYLALTGRAHRRERLCGLFWDVADDPRGALRWSLSKLRRIVGDRLVADRESVALACSEIEIDRDTLRTVGSRHEAESAESLERAARLYRGELLEGLELPDFDEITAWLVAERETARRHALAVLGALLERRRDDAEGALPYARRLADLDPRNEANRLRLVRLLAATDRTLEARQHLASLRRIAEEEGRPPSGALRAAELDVVERRRPSPPEPSPTPPPGPQVTHSVRSAMHGAPLVGRAAEMATLRELLEGVATRRRAHVVLLRGEPGIGKSRLLFELSTEARRRGGTVLAGAAFEVEQTRPFGPFSDALRRVPIGVTSARNEQALAPMLGRAIDEEARRHDRDAMFDAVVELISTMANAAPVTLVLDDVQWLDAASAELLHYVARTARQRPLLVALAARDGELPDARTAMKALRLMRREGMLTEVRVGPLDEDALAALVVQASQSADAAAIGERSGGNPLFALELARSAGAGETLSELVRDRLERLDRDALEVLRWAAVLGRTFDVRRLEKVAEADGATMLAALETLEAHSLVATPLERGTALEFAHGVVHQVVYGELSHPRRMLMHRRVARLLDAEEADANEIARHALAAGESELATQACLSAARRCVRAFAPAEARALARRGLAHAASLEDPVRTERSVELWEVLASVGRLHEAGVAELEALAERALDLDRPAHARLAFHLSSHQRWESDEPLDARRIMLRAEEASRASSDAERAVALAEAARCLVLLDRDLPKAEAWLREAQALARRESLEPLGIADALGMLHLHRGELDEAREQLSRARTLAARARDVRSEARALECLALIELRAKNPIDAVMRSEELLGVVARLEDGSERAFADGLDALCQLRLARPGAAERLCGAMDRLRELDAKRWQCRLALLAAEVAFERGEAAQAKRFAELAMELATVLHRASDLVLARALLARACEADGEPERAAEERCWLRDVSTRELDAFTRATLAKTLAE